MSGDVLESSGRVRIGPGKGAPAGQRPRNWLRAACAASTGVAEIASVFGVIERIARASLSGLMLAALISLSHLTVSVRM